MKSLIIDRDRDSSDRLKAALELQGHEVVVQPTKSEGLEWLKQTSFDAVFFDPAPQIEEGRAFILMVKRTIKPVPVVILTGRGQTAEDAQKAGAMGVLTKPYASDAELVKTTAAIARLVALNEELATEGYESPSRNGIIARSAFHQLYIACLDRADRYAEKAYYIRIEIENYAALGEQAEAVAQGIHEELVRIKRLSDLGGHIIPSVFGILLMRPMREDEPILATNRIAEFFMRDFPVITKGAKAEMKVELIEIPTGIVLAQHLLPQ